MSTLARLEQTGLATADNSSVTFDLPMIFQLATKLTKARGFLPQHLQNDGEIAAVILAGAELGIPAMAAIRGIKLVKGNVTLDASLQLGVMMKNGVKPKWLEDGAKGVARLQLTRPGHDTHEQVFTMEDAQRAGLTGGENWKKYPAAMLRARCVSAAGKAFCPDILAGVYTPDELEHIDAPRVESKPAKRTLDDLAGGAAPRPLEDIQTHTQTQTTGQTGGQSSTRTTDVEYDGVTGQIIPVFEDHLAALANVEDQLTGNTESNLRGWYETLTTMQLTGPQKKAAWNAFKVRCADYELDANSFTSKEG